MKKFLVCLIVLSLLVPNTMISASADDFVYEPATDEIINVYMSQADALVDEIVNNQDSIEVQGTKYYVSSSKGNDSNDGLSPDTPWRTINKVNTTKFNPGDGVYFKRGDSWRTSVALEAKSGIAYSAYGSGDKPKFIGSVDASDMSSWSETDTENVYVYNKPIVWSTNNVATIIFDYGKAWGIHVSAYDNGKRINNGGATASKVYNGIETYVTPAGTQFTGAQDLKNNLEFWHDEKTDLLYLYSRDGHPSDIFSSIEIVDDGQGISVSGENVIVDNIHVYGYGSRGITMRNVQNVTVQYCTVEWVGGSVISWWRGSYDYPIRHGNGICCEGKNTNLTFKYNYVSQVYNCALSSRSGGHYQNLTMTNNVVDYAGTFIEFDMGGSGTTYVGVTGLKINNNFGRYIGYGFTHQRPSGGGTAYFSGSKRSMEYGDNDISGNTIIYCSSSVYAVGAYGEDFFSLHDNTYIIDSGSVAVGANYFSLGAVNFSEAGVKMLTAGKIDPGANYYYVSATLDEKFERYKSYKPSSPVDKFDDIPDNFWGKPAINETVLRGLFSGISENQFSPNGKMTRAMLVTVLSRLDANMSRETDTSFTDVKPTDWYAESVKWAEDNKIVDAGTIFRPNENATREEMADMLYRYALTKYKQGSLDGAKSFVDFASITPAYSDGIKFCTKNGIIGGYSDNTIKPKNEATRAEVATMIVRFAKYLRTAPVDEAAAVANAKSVILKAEKLKNILDNNLVRATLEADGSVKFVPFKDSGVPAISIFNAFDKSFRFIDYPYIAVRYNAQITDPEMAAQVYSSSDSGSTLRLAPSDTSFVIDISEFASAIDPSGYSNNLTIKIMPWGSKSRALDLTDFFVIEEIGFFDNLFAAQAYAE